MFFLRQTIVLLAGAVIIVTALPSPSPQGGFIGVTKCAGHVGAYACYNANTIVLCTSDDQGTPVSYCGTGQTCTTVEGLPYCI
ncbi:hypothetical protein PFICI_13626 [Pestalotiopsis fici W106-1]|uniref:Carbohydrate-binding module family 19 domain-containing protein n=1 Tax=Pestalotiopsis fici (strain W106-1 / CGMCC3.15140) TaxID=1229662 RepID=W3WPR4_PESFW|nr:uncharacterized protein PFICI_13626 [Pestalotiopsis fici W106-1]ETS75142.1 hypothetical protein PFICI_13626 [Pestalotiopsis fici W106-1]